MEGTVYDTRRELLIIDERNVPNFSSKTSILGDNVGPLYSILEWLAVGRLEAVKITA